MAALNFPNLPTVGQIYLAPNGASYTWNGIAWLVGGTIASGGGSSVTVSPTPPASPKAGDVWWESDTGQMFVSYDDGNSQQWVQSSPTADPGSVYTKAEIDVLLRNKFFAAYQAGSQSVTNNAWNVALLPETSDPDNWYDPATGKFQPNVAGFYDFFGTFISGGTGTINRGFCALHRNGTEFFRSADVNIGSSGGAIAAANTAGSLLLNGTTDYVQFAVYPIVPSGTITIAPGSTFAGHLARRT